MCPCCYLAVADRTGSSHLLLVADGQRPPPPVAMIFNTGPAPSPPAKEAAKPAKSTHLVRAGGHSARPGPAHERSTLPRDGAVAGQTRCYIRLGRFLGVLRDSLSQLPYGRGRRSLVWLSVAGRAVLISMYFLACTNGDQITPPGVTVRSTEYIRPGSRHARRKVIRSNNTATIISEIRHQARGSRIGVDFYYFDISSWRRIIRNRRLVTGPFDRPTPALLICARARCLVTCCYSYSYSNSSSGNYYQAIAQYGFPPFRTRALAFSAARTIPTP